MYIAVQLGAAVVGALEGAALRVAGEETASLRVRGLRAADLAARVARAPARRHHRLFVPVLSEQSPHTIRSSVEDNRTLAYGKG